MTHTLSLFTYQIRHGIFFFPPACYTFPMNITELLSKTVEKSTVDQPVVNSYAEHQAFLDTTYHFQNSPRRLTYDLVTLTGWHTSPRSKQEFFYATISAPDAYTFLIPFENGMRCALHAHTHIELIYIVDGSLRIHIEDQDVSLSQGEMLLISAGVMHGEYLLARDCTILCLDVDDSFFDQYIGADRRTDYMQALRKLLNQKRSEYLYIRFSPFDQTPLTYHAFYTILEELIACRPGKKHIIIGYVERIIDLLTQEFRMQVMTEDTKAWHNALLSDIKQYINTHLATVSVSAVANAFHYSPDYLNRLFRGAEDITLSAYIQEIRLAKAMQFLHTTDRSIASIAEAVGYHNQGFFYRKFKERYGLLPGNIRR